MSMTTVLGFDQYLFGRSFLAWIIYTLLKSSQFVYLIIILLILFLLDVIPTAMKKTEVPKKITFPVIAQIVLGSFTLIMVGFFAFVKARLTILGDPLLASLAFLGDPSNFLILHQIYIGAICFNLLIPIGLREVRHPDLGIARPRISPIAVLRMGCVGFVAIIIFSGLWSLLYPNTLGEPTVRVIVGMRSMSRIWYAAVAIIFVPIVEELLFRGYIYAALRERIGVVWGLFIVAAVFALMHGDAMARIVPIFMVGCVLTFIYDRSGSLYPSIVVHSLVNAFPVIVALFGARG